jgi:hypothetical protein
MNANMKNPLMFFVRNLSSGEARDRASRAGHD